MQIMFINNDGGGFADRLSIEGPITITELFRRQMPNSEPADYLIRVNRQSVSADYLLQEGDRISITPTKVEGATR